MDSTFIDDLGADSLDIVELIMAFEEEFNTEIPDDVAEKIRTVRDAVELLDKEGKIIASHYFRKALQQGLSELYP